MPELPALRRSTFRAPTSASTQHETPAPPETAVAPIPPASDERQPRHRADHARNRRATAGMFRRSVALGCATAIMGVSAFGAVAASATAGSSVASPAAPAESTTVTADTITPSIEAPVAHDVEPAVTGELSVASAPFTGGTQVTVTGKDLDEVAGVTVGGTPAAIVAVDEQQVTFAVPAVADTALGTSAEVRFADAAGQAVDVEQPASPAAAGTLLLHPLEQELTVAAEPPVPATPRTLTMTYTSDPAIDAQLDYVLTYWSSYNSGQYPVLHGVDCANFASQSLIARGWAMDAGWYVGGAGGGMSPSWASSTALRDYLNTRTDGATPLDDSQRALVKVGDIAQFDWDGSGDRDHTAVVTRVERTAAGTKVWVGGHTKDADFWDVDTALATGGGTVSYFSLR
ncbi:amidase domain-containing protein [Agromyces ramosus]|uniref:amidase domain-containing protein n=1 Tax=Agromyces ramosus TaxID=33879 RepID=UPI0027D80A7A|nr:amidase domain-containing protein [Agromyces ramosus]